MTSTTFARALGLAALMLVASGGAAFAAQRTFVASYGSDAAACTLTAPCRQFNAAVALTDTDGEVIALDSAGYGSVTILRSVTISAAPGIYAGISVFPGSDGITVNTPFGNGNNRVVLRGLTINMQGFASPWGIRVYNTDMVVVDRCTIVNMWRGVGFYPSYGQQRLIVRDTTFRGGTRGIEVIPATANGALAHVNVWHSTFENQSSVGMSTADIARVSVTESNFTDNADGLTFESTSLSTDNPSIALDRVEVIGNSSGLTVWGSGSVTTVVNVSNSTFANNTAEAISVQSHGYVRLMDNHIGGNGTGVSRAASGAGVATLGNNMLKGNVADYAGPAADTIVPF